jgi:hypothetical protein
MNNTQQTNVTPSPDTVDFFKNLSKRMMTYHKNIEKVKKYIKINKLKDTNKMSNLVIMCVIWTAHQLKEYLTETDILVILGSQSDMDGTNIMSLDPELRQLELFELMDVLVNDKKD